MADVPIVTDTTAVNTVSLGDFKANYNDSDFIYEIQPRELTVWERFKEWLASWFANLFKISDPAKAITIAEVVFKVFCVLLLIFVVYVLVKSILNNEGNWIFGRNLGKRVLDYEITERDLRTMDFEKLVHEAMLSGETRLAVRYYYLWLLRLLSEKEQINWDAEKTNSDYLYELANSPFRDDFAYLSYLYNHIWYGEIIPDDVAFDKTQKAFAKTIQTLRK